MADEYGEELADQNAKHLLNFYNASKTLPYHRGKKEQVGHIVNVHPQRRTGRRTDYSGHKGKALVAQTSETEDYNAVTVVDGVVRKHQPLHIPALSRDIPKGIFTVHLTSNPATVTINENKAGKGIQSIALKTWQFTADVEDSSTTATPVGPIMLRVEGDKFRGYDHLIDNVKGATTDLFPLIWNLNSNETFTSMPEVNGVAHILKHWKDGDGTLSSITINLYGPDGSSLVTFTAATLQFEITYTQWG